MILFTSCNGVDQKSLEMMRTNRPIYRFAEDNHIDREYKNIEDLINGFRQDRKEEPTETKFRGYIEGRFACGEITETLYTEANQWIEKEFE